MFFKKMIEIWSHLDIVNVVATVLAYGKKTYNFNLDLDNFMKKVPLLDNIQQTVVTIVNQNKPHLSPKFKTNIQQILALIGSNQQRRRRRRRR